MQNFCGLTNSIGEVRACCCCFFIGVFSSSWCLWNSLGLRFFCMSMKNDDEAEHSLNPFMHSPVICYQPFKDSVSVDYYANDRPLAVCLVTLIVWKDLSSLSFTFVSIMLHILILKLDINEYQTSR